VLFLIAIVIAIEEKLDDISPQNPVEDSQRTIKYCIDKFLSMQPPFVNWCILYMESVSCY